MNSLHWLAWTFTATNVVRVFFYLPQIAALARSTDTSAIALSTWWVWLLNNLLGAAYVAVGAQDLAMALSFIGSAVGCGAVIALTLYKRHPPRQARLAAVFRPEAEGSKLGF